MAQLGRWLLGAALAFLAAGCGGKEATPAGGAGTGQAAQLRVGVILPMSGDQSTYGEESWNGMLLAMDDLAAKGADWKLLLKDEKSTKQEAGNQAKLLIENEKVDILLGSVASSNTEQIAVEARESGIPLITPASTNDMLTVNGGPFVSRICFKDSFQGAVLASFAISEGWRKAVVVVDKAQVYSTGLAENFRQVFTAKGGSVATEYYTTQDTDFANTVENVARHGPDVIFISGYYAQGGPMIKQGKEKWKGVPVLGGDGLDSPDLIGLVGETDARIYLSSHFAADAPDEAVRSFAQRYEKRFGKAPGAMAALGYDILFVLHDAVGRCADPHDPDALAKAIRETRGVKGITGTIDLTTPDRTPVKDAVIVRVEGTFKHHRTIPAAAK